MASSTSAGEEESFARRTQRRFTTHCIPTTTGSGHGHALAWGWMFKQGQGGLLHRKNWKKRFFVLYAVPQGHCLVYYGSDTVCTEELLGFIDIRSVTKINPGHAQLEGEQHRTLELVTPARTFCLAPISINTEIAKSGSKGWQYVFGWPVATPAFGMPLLTKADNYARVLDLWTEKITVAHKSEQECVHLPANVLKDSSGTLESLVTLRISPISFVLLNPDDDSLALQCATYKELLEWTVPQESELYLRMEVSGKPVTQVFCLPEALEVLKLIEMHISKLMKNQAAAATTGGAGGAAGAKPSTMAAAASKRRAPRRRQKPAMAAVTESADDAADAVPDAAGAGDDAPAAPEAAHDADVASATAAVAAVSLTGWKTYVDKATGKKYYANKSTGETSWTWPPKPKA